MKRMFFSFIIFLIIPLSVSAAEFSQNDYESYLSHYDLSFFENELDRTTYKILEELGVNDFNYFNLNQISINDFVKAINSTIRGTVNDPIKTFVTIVVLVIVSSLIKNMDFDVSSLSDVYSSITGLLVSTILLVKIGHTISLCVSTLSIASNFIFAFVPTFAGIILATGSVATSISTNTLLLLLAQGLSFISSNMFMPLVNSFLALGICSSLKSEFHLNKMITSIKSGITKCIAFTSAVFVSILSLKTTISSKSDILGIRSVRFAINSVVPVIGSTISEGLLSIQSYSSLMKNSVGIVGIIAVFLTFFVPIFEVTVWRICLSVCSSISDIFADTTVSCLLEAFKDAMLLINVLLIISMMTTIVSFGILIATGG